MRLTKRDDSLYSTARAAKSNEKLIGARVKLQDATTIVFTGADIPRLLYTDKLLHVVNSDIQTFAQPLDRPGARHYFPKFNRINGASVKFCNQRKLAEGQVLYISSFRL